MISSLYRLGLFALTLTILGACGQKGPLFLPDKPPAISTPYPTTTSKENTKAEEN
jgi:predicted small lipoprotein YifL